jgi:transposase-like protein
MAEDRMAVLDMLRKATVDGNVDVLREGVRVLAEAIMEAEVSELTGAAKGERAPDRRLTNRNGYRERRWAPGSARSAWPSPRSATARTSPPSSSRGGGPSGPS